MNTPTFQIGEVVYVDSADYKTKTYTIVNDIHKRAHGRLLYKLDCDSKFIFFAEDMKKVDQIIDGDGNKIWIEVDPVDSDGTVLKRIMICEDGGGYTDAVYFKVVDDPTVAVSFFKKMIAVLLEK